jgi:hypothetical protein
LEEIKQSKNYQNPSFFSKEMLAAQREKTPNILWHKKGLENNQENNVVKLFVSLNLFYPLLSFGMSVLIAP